MGRRLYFLLVAFLCLPFSPAFADTSFNAADDFSLTGNPNGTWSYGYKLTSSSAFQLFDTAVANTFGVTGLEHRYASALDVEPHVIHNSTNAGVAFRDTVSLGAKSLQFHPGPNGQLAVVRWKAPNAGMFLVDAAFRGNDTTSTLVEIQKNGTTLFNGEVNGYGPGPTYSSVISFAANDILDFLVDANGAHQNDSTGLAVTVNGDAVSALNLLLGSSCLCPGETAAITDGNLVTGQSLFTFSGSFNIFPSNAVDLDHISILPAMTPNGTVVFEIQTSTDPAGSAGTWTSHGGQLSRTWSDQTPLDVVLNPNTTGVRVVKVIVHSSPSWVALYEVQGFGASPGVVQNARLTVTASGTGSGSVVSGETPAHFNCTSAAGVTSGNCQSDETEGATVTLTATPANGSTFSGWSGACTNAIGTCTVIMDSAKTVVAGFRPSTGFTKISNIGGDLPISATLGTASNDWACTRDNATGLIWEVKTNNVGLRDWNNTYTNFDDPTLIQDWTGTQWRIPTQTDIESPTNSIGFQNMVNVQGLCGASDWRRPSKVELSGIVGGLMPAIDTTFFPNTASWIYWTGSGAFHTYDSWIVRFDDGNTSAYADRYLFNHLRLVRDGHVLNFHTLTIGASGSGIGAITSGETPEHINCTSAAGTTSGTCSSNETMGASVTLTATPSAGSTFTGWSGACTNATGTCTVTMDAAKAVGASFGPTSMGSYTDNGDGTVADTRTGIVWMRCGIGQMWSSGNCSGTPTPYTWDEAMALTQAFANHNDWRLPTKDELAGIVDLSPSNPTINTIAFPNTSAWNYWSSTLYPDGGAWVVDFGDGSAGNSNKPSPNYVRLMRSTTATLTVTGSGTGTGTITSGETPAHFNCTSAAGVTSGDCQSDETEGATVTLTATPANGSTFSGWSGELGDCNSFNPVCTVTMSGSDKQVVAQFEALAANVPAPPTLNAIVKYASATNSYRLDTSAIPGGTILRGECRGSNGVSVPARDGVFNESLVHGLTDGITYSCAVRFSNANGFSSWSNSKDVTVVSDLPDTDGDGLPDAWEDAGALGSINLSEANDGRVRAGGKLVKDVYLWIDAIVPPKGFFDGDDDYLPLQTDAVRKVQDSFLLHGVNLHVRLNQITQDQLTTAGLPAELTQDQIDGGLLPWKAIAFRANDPGGNRDRIYRYALFGDHFRSKDGETKHTGTSWPASGVFFIAGALMKGTDDQAGTLMHELGHTFGLSHGGPYFDINSSGKPDPALPIRLDMKSGNKPNYLSVMNYLFQRTGVVVSDKALRFDYASVKTGSIDERTGLFQNEIMPMSGNPYGPNPPPNLSSAIYGTRVKCDTGLTGKYLVEIADLSTFSPVKNSYEDVVGYLDVKCDNLIPSNNSRNGYDVNADETDIGILRSYTDWDALVYAMGSVGAGYGATAGSWRDDYSAFYQAEIDVVEDAPAPGVAEYGVGVSTATGSRDALPGQLLMAQFEVRNSGLNEDTYDLVLTSDLGWTVSLTGSPAITLSPGSSRLVWVSMQVPVNAVVGQQDRLFLSATGRADGADDSRQILVSVVATAPADSDGDGLDDAAEAALGTNPGNPDTDADGYIDSSDFQPLEVDSVTVQTATFATITGAPQDTWMTSGAIVVQGPTIAVPIGIAGGEYSVNSAAFTSQFGTVSAGQSVVVRVRSSVSSSTQTIATLNISGMVALFDVTTQQGTNSYVGSSSTGTGVISASFTGGGGGCVFATNQFIPISGVATPPPPGVVFLQGLFDFTTGGCTPGSTLNFTITYPQALPVGAKYWKFGPTPTDPTYHWYILPATVAGNTVTFSITDGGIGDDDLTANGTIVDQGGPGSGAASIPTLSEWGMAIISLLLAGLALLTLRRQRSEGLGL